MYMCLYIHASVKFSVTTIIMSTYSMLTTVLFFNSVFSLFLCLSHAHILSLFLSLMHTYTHIHRMTLLFFCLSGMDVLNCLNISPSRRYEIIEWIYSQQVLPDPNNPGMNIQSL